MSIKSMIGGLGLASGPLTHPADFGSPTLQSQTEILVRYSLTMAVALLASTATNASAAGGGRTTGIDQSPRAARVNQAVKPLPPLDCWRCTGPAVCPPCESGFLYYGTNPWDDDPRNDFDDCPGGACGRLGRKASLLWIRLHDRHGIGLGRERSLREPCWMRR